MKGDIWQDIYSDLTKQDIETILRGYTQYLYGKGYIKESAAMEKPSPIMEFLNTTDEMAQEIAEYIGKDIEILKRYKRQLKAVKKHFS